MEGGGVARYGRFGPTRPNIKPGTARAAVTYRNMPLYIVILHNITQQGTCRRVHAGFYFLEKWFRRYMAMVL